MAMLLTMIMSVWLFAFTPTLQLLLGVVVASVSIALYYLPVGVLAQGAAQGGPGGGGGKVGGHKDKDAHQQV